MDAVTLMTIAALAMIAAMVCAWIVVRLTGNGGWIDAFWSFGTGALGTIFALAPGDGAMTWRQIAVAALVGLWGLRLGLHVAIRTAKHPEDARYAGLREAWGTHYWRNLLGFAVVQAVAAILLALAMYLAGHNPAPGFRWIDALGVIVLAVAILGEGIADRQLTRFKADSSHRGLVFDTGLWSWSRHPNYFFEWLGWVAYPIFAINPGGDPWSWASLLGPALMYGLLVHGSGIPPLERHMLRSRGDAYRAYQARTSAFVPWPPRA
jgi:steroid 5-alpha reductase family enzyme